MSTSASSSSSSTKKSRSLFSRINLRFPWLKLAVVIFLGIVMILDLLDLTISKTVNLNNKFPTAPMSKHVKATDRTLEGKKLVALTFDDGPSAETTPRLLDILNEKNTIATFFMLGVMARNNQEIVKRANREGHEIASHTMYHQNLVLLSPEDAAIDVDEANQVFKSIINRYPALTRPPYGNFDDKVRDAVKTPLILWSVDPEDWRNKNPDTIFEIAMNQIHDGAIILLHDVYPTTIEAVPRLIDALRESNYEFVTVSELAKARKVNLVTRDSYFNFKP